MTEPSDPLEITEEQRRIINRLRRLEGQIRGLQSMIESGQHCEAVLTQVMAAKSALNQVGMQVIGHAMKECLITDEVTDRDALIDESIKVFLKYSSCVK
jgi:CsoR family transcriptional regulator, copper-sensing transcriptional repressor